MQQKLVWVSVHDYLSAKISAEAGADTLLVGDSLGMTVYGFDSTKQVTLEMMLRHAEAIQRAVPGDSPNIVVDLPFGTYDSTDSALQSAKQFRNLGINHLKIEGGNEVLLEVIALVKNDFQITGHLGLLPQTAKKYSVAATSRPEQEQLLSDAKKLEKAGIAFLVLECVFAESAQKIADELTIPVIGIGAGAKVDGQVLVYSDLIGRTPRSFSPRFIRRFGDAQAAETASIEAFCTAVRSNDFPHSSEAY